MPGIKTVFFCGQQSRYGLAHLVPILDQFDLGGVVFATRERWAVFHEKLSGRRFYTPRAGDLYSIIARVIPTQIKQGLKGGSREEFRARKLLRERNVPVWDIFDINAPQFIEKLREVHVDLVLSAAYPQIISRKVLEVPNRGAVNFHPSLLPKYRGAHPHFWQIVHGAQEGGVTAHFMTERIDDGDILAQLSFPIADCRYSELYDLIVDNTPRLIHMVRTFFERGGAKPIPQNDKEATYFKNNREIHSRIFWSSSPARDVYNLIRTETAFFYIRNERVIVLEATIVDSNRNLTNEVRVDNGTVVDMNQGGIVVRLMDGCVCLNMFKLGRRVYPHPDFARKMNLCIGEILG